MAADLILAVQVYCGAGLAVAAVFLLWGVGRIMPAARGAYIFRTLLVPGCVLLWPLVLWRWWRLERGPGDWAALHAPPRRLQDRLAVALAIVIPVVILVGLSVRQDGPFERPALQLAGPSELSR